MSHPVRLRIFAGGLSAAAASFVFVTAFLLLTFAATQMAYSQETYENQYPNVVGTDDGLLTASGTFSPWFLPVGDANGGITPQSHFQLQSTTMEGGSVIESLVVQGGIDSSTNQGLAPYGGVTVRGANVTADTGAFYTNAGSTVIQGGDNFSEGTSLAAGGSLTIRPGAATAAYYGANSIPGHLVISQTFRMGLAYTYKDPYGFPGGKLGCITGHNTIGDCPTAPSNNFIGILQAPIPDKASGSNGSGGYLANAGSVAIQGYVTAQSATLAHFTPGDIVCVDPINAGYAIDNGTSLCSTLSTPTAQVGVVTLGDPPGGGGTYSHSIMILR